MYTEIMYTLFIEIYTHLKIGMIRLMSKHDSHTNIILYYIT